MNCDDSTPLLSLRTASHAVWQSCFFFHHTVGIEHLPIRAARLRKRALQLMSSAGGGGPNAPEEETFLNCQFHTGFLQNLSLTYKTVVIMIPHSKALFYQEKVADVIQLC
jgi:hypothetical protein